MKKIVTLAAVILMAAAAMADETSTKMMKLFDSTQNKENIQVLDRTLQSKNVEIIIQARGNVYVDAVWMNKFVDDNFNSFETINLDPVNAWVYAYCWAKNEADHAGTEMLELPLFGTGNTYGTSFVMNGATWEFYSACMSETGRTYLYLTIVE